MRFLTRRREDEIVAYIEAARIEHILEMEEKDEIIAAAVKEIALLQDAWKEAIRLQRDIVQAFIIAREQPEVDLDWDLEEMLEAISDQLAQLGEHLPI
jgi:hypothetical protein